MTDLTKPIWRLVTDRSYRLNPGYFKHWAVGGSTTLTLSCGHKSYRKMSRPTPQRVRCHECERLRSGSMVRYDRGDGFETVETWDPETNLPKHTQRTTNEKDH